MYVSKLCRLCIISNEGDDCMVSVQATPRQLQTGHQITSDMRNGEDLNWESIADVRIQEMIVAFSPQTV